jgi:large subunit ribosomal protein L19e
MASKLTLQKRLAADIMKVGKSKIWLDPDKEKMKEIAGAITRSDVRKMISRGLIKERHSKPKMPKPLTEKKRRRGRGSKEGKKHTRMKKKQRWIGIVRPLRAMLRELKAQKAIDNATYRHMYLQIKGGQFRSRSHMRIYLEQRGIVKPAENKAKAK